MRLLGLDFETTGLSPEEDYIIEVGAVVWDTEKKIPVCIDSYFVKHDGIDVSEEVSQKNGILNEYLDEFGLPSQVGLERLGCLMFKCDAVVAHNGEAFDRKFFNKWIERVVGTGKTFSKKMPWVDTQLDVMFPEAVTTRKLTYLAAEHGFLNPFAHRAVFDVVTMLKILDNYDLDTVLFSAEQPTITVRANVSYDDRQLAKDMSFRWDGDRRRWIRTFKKHIYEQMLQDRLFKFPTQVVEA